MKTKLKLFSIIIFGLLIAFGSIDAQENSTKKSIDSEFEKFWNDFQNALKTKNVEKINEFIYYPYRIWNERDDEVTTIPSYESMKRNEPWGEVDEFKNLTNDLKGKEIKLAPIVDLTDNFYQQLNIEQNKVIYICDLTNKQGYGSKYVVTKLDGRIKIIGFYYTYED